MSTDAKWILWILGALMLVVSSLSGYSVARVDSVQQDLSEKYVQKIDYRADLGRIETSLKCLNDKMDRVLAVQGQSWQRQ